MEVPDAHERMYQSPHGRVTQVAEWMPTLEYDGESPTESLHFDDRHQLFLRVGKDWRGVSLAESVAWFTTCDQRQILALGDLMEDEQAKLDWLRAVERGLRDAAVE